MSQNAKDLCHIWNTLLLSNSIEVCSDKLKGLGITDVKLMKLCFLHPEYKLKDYLEKLAIPNSTLTNMVNRLTTKELLKRDIDQTDFRSYCLKLTDNGESAIKEHFEAEQIIMKKLLSSLSEGEQEQFLTLFQKLISPLDF